MKQDDTMNPIANPVVELKDVHKSFGSNQVLKGVSFAIRDSLEALKSLNGLPTNLIVVGRTLRLPEPRLQQAAMQPPNRRNPPKPISSQRFKSPMLRLIKPIYRAQGQP